MPSEVPRGWTRRKLGNLGSTYTGLSGKTKVDFGEGKPFVTYRQVFNGGAIDITACDHVSVAEGERQNVVRSGDVLFTTSSETPEEVAYSAVVQGDVPEMYLNSFCFGFRPALTEGLSTDFSKYFFRGPDFRAAAVQLGQGSTRYNISKTKLMEVFLLLPPLPEQRKIAAILSSVDEAIQATQAVIEQTRRVKEGLLQDLLTRGLPGHTRFKQTEIGEIPESWEVRRLPELCTRVGVGIACSATHAYRDEGVPLVRNQNIKPGYLDLSDLLYVTAEYDEENRTKRIREGDVLTIRTGYPGISAVVPRELDNTQCFTTLVSRPRPNLLNPHYLAAWINSSGGKQFVLGAKAGGAQQNLNAGTLKSLPVPLPTLHEQSCIVKMLDDLSAAERCNETALGELQQVKTGLLQDLLTGKVRVSA